MTEFGEDIDAILAKGAGEWSNEETKKIYALMKAGHKAKLQERMIEVRGGEKPKIQDAGVKELINNQEPVN